MKNTIKKAINVNCLMLSQLPGRLKSNVFINARRDSIDFWAEVSEPSGSFYQLGAEGITSDFSAQTLE